MVNEVQEKVIEEVKENMKASMLDMLASKLLKEKDFEEHVLHGIGHGIGLSVHEKPTLSPFSDDILVKGNVITIEPGIYIRGKYGVRVEDIVLINSNAIKLS